MLRGAPSPNRFYKAKRKFYFPRMCNWWVAARLMQAGCSIEPWTVITASRAMSEARECSLR
jgi:surface antigen